MANRLAGTSFFSVDGKRFMLVTAKYSPVKVERETLTGLSGVDGFTEKPKLSFIEVELRDSGDLTVADFNAMSDVTCVLELANGKTIMGRKMWTTSAQEVESGEAKLTARFEGVDGAVSELVA